MPENRFGNKIVTDQEGTEFSLYAPANVLYRLPLTDDGTDRTLNEDYSGTATDAFVAFTRSAVITKLDIIIIDGDVAQNALADPELFVGNNTALTNGLKFLVENSSGTLKLNITNSPAITTMADLMAFCTYYTITTQAASATTANNGITFIGEVDFSKKFGRAISVNLGDRFVCVLNDNFSTAANYVRFEMFISGYYL
jgi:hypothetical protein